MLWVVVSNGEELVMTLVSLVFLLLLPGIVISFRGFLERGRRRRIEDGKNKSFEQTRKQNFPERFENEKQRKKNVVILIECVEFLL